MVSAVCRTSCCAFVTQGYGPFSGNGDKISTTAGCSGSGARTTFRPERLQNAAVGQQPARRHAAPKGLWILIPLEEPCWRLHRTNIELTHA